MPNHDLRRAWKKQQATKQDVTNALPALMGNGHGTIEVPGQPGYVYIRLGQNDLGQAYNNRCPLADNLAIYVGYDPVLDPDRRIFQVLSVRMADYAASGNDNVYVNVPPHHATHEYGGGDDVYIEWRRLMGLRVGRPSGFQVTVDDGVLFRAGAWMYVPSQNLDLSAYQPAGVLSCYVLITLDNAGTAIATAGADIAGALDISDCPAPAADEIPLAAVRLYGLQTQIGDTPTAPDIVDLRFPQTSSAGPSIPADHAHSAAGDGGPLDWDIIAAAPGADVVHNHTSNAEGGTLAGLTGWFNVKAYGAAGDGATDDTASITAAIAAVTAAGRGVLYFPAGSYLTTGGFTISVPTTILGDGMAGFDATGYVSEVLDSSNANSLFTVTAYTAEFRGIALRNTFGGTPISGAGVTVNGASLVQRVNFDTVSVSGFYNNVDIQVGTAWTIRNMWNVGPVNYGLKIQNTVNNDAGDWSISDSNFFAATYDSAAAIRIESSGGGKIVNTKINMALDGKKFNHGIDLNPSALSASTTILLMTNVSIENVRGNGFNAVNTSATKVWSVIQFTNCEFGFYGSGTYPIYMNATTVGMLRDVVIEGVTFRADPHIDGPAISLTNIEQVSIGHIINDGFSSILSDTGCVYVNDESMPRPSHYEVLMAPGVTPPDPILTPDETDWIYVGV